MLAPFGTDVATEEQEDPAGEDGGEDVAGIQESSPPLSQALSPSSIGLSVLLAADQRELTAHAEWGDYLREQHDAAEEDDDPSDAAAPADDSSDEDGPADNHDNDDDANKAKKRPRERWRRVPSGTRTCRLTLRPGAGLQTDDVGDGIRIEHVSRTLPGVPYLAVSVFLVNRRESRAQGRPRADLWIFQPSLKLSSASDGAPFVPRDLEPEEVRTDPDLEANALLFRNRREFAIGHGCAAEWTSASSASASLVSTTLLPRFELPRVDPQTVEATTVSMEALSGLSSGEDVHAALDPLVNAYGTWVDELRGQVDRLAPDLRPVAEYHVERCAEARDRIADACDLLAESATVRRAFNFANHAMLLQRSHSDWAEARRSDPAAAPVKPSAAGEWRPFQLAFILLNLRGIVYPNDPSRGIGDLLWFPTGGGKTEAYLGLAAFTLGLRRLRDDPAYRTDAGVTVLMRYTLRLLTIQQFQRASTMICACETLRRAAPEVWGTRRFSIGLWLGKQATPNSHKESQDALVRIRKKEPQDEANPCQLESCPWCGEALTVADFEDVTDLVRTRVTCARTGCEFADEEQGGLPVVMVDEEIYRECPSMVIATVDKFAQMPWNGETQALFGRVSAECDRCGFLTPDSEHPKYHRAGSGRSEARLHLKPTEWLAPPELVIQDELHLISGPLGTMVGLYETAIDALCTRSWEGELVGPKIVASTATIRRAFEQVKALFGRDLRVFPPLGLDANDSFFAAETPVSDHSPGRLYLGVSAPGKSMKTALVRVSAALLSASAGVRERRPATADPYMTLVAYFNSLRELGGAVRLMEDDVTARLRQLRARGMPQRNRPVYQELTSRVRSDEIPTILRRLKMEHHAPREANTPLPLDAVLASNMISVGIDVTRLGLMAVLGQPKTTAEYIQATSRVGRSLDGPGLVVTIYNWVRPRDLSHFERFRHYHESLYRHVEAVSVTPFSARARDRGLAGAFVSLVRLMTEGLDPESGAGEFDAADPDVERAIETFVRRASRLTDNEVAAAVANALRAHRDEWGGLARHSLIYGWRTPYPDKNPPPAPVLLRSAEGGTVGHWRTPGSLREVEETARVYIREPGS
jgi:hypothetical protein